MDLCELGFIVITAPFAVFSIFVMVLATAHILRCAFPMVALNEDANKKEYESECESDCESDAECDSSSCSDNDNPTPIQKKKNV